MNTADDERYIPLKQDGRDSVVTVASERTAGPEHVETAQMDSDALARLSDPALAARRERIAAQVKDRSRLTWMPASELMRHSSQRGADAISHGQERLHRAVREATVAGTSKVAQAVGERVRGLGAPRPVIGRPQQSEPVVTRQSI